MKINCFILSVLLVIAVGACTPANAGDSPPHWTYEGEEGPEHWGELNPTYAVCNAGQSQSPINISATNENDLANIDFNYQPSTVNILNNGHTVQVNYDAGSYIELDAIRYDLLQFHYHAPSEHVIDGKSFPAEIHLVHKNADGQLAVVGILLEEGAENSAFDPFINNLPIQETEAKDAGTTINATEFLPTTQTTFRYSGSLTTPPCSEGVNWLVMTTAVELSSTQLSKLDELFENNNRPLQEVNDRSIVEDNTP